MSVQRSRDRGAAAVEAALVLPMLLMVVFGLIDFGRMLNAQITINEGAREAARAVSLGYAPGETAMAVDGLGARTTIERSCADGDTVKVTVTHRFRFVTPVVALADLTTGEIELTAVGVMPCRS